MEAGDERGAEVRFPPLLVYLAAMIAGWALGRWVLPLPTGLGIGSRIGAGVIAGLVGLILVVPAVARFRATGQDPRPWEPTPELIEQGIYRFSRNPMYLGLALVQVGVGVGVDNLWMVLTSLPALAAVHAIAVRPEELYLEERFGDDYRDYKARVRRWL